MNKLAMFTAIVAGLPQLPDIPGHDLFNVDCQCDGCQHFNELVGQGPDE